jgi:hypothetical protein
MDSLYVFAAGVLLVLLIWKTVAVSLRFGAWVVPVVLSLDIASALFGSVVGFVAWKTFFFFMASRLDPVRGLFRMPRWPRAGQMRGARRPRYRRIPEPSPWDRGPFTH